MQTTRPVVVAILIAAAAGCGGDGETGSAAVESAALPDSIVVARGGAAADRLARGLIGPLSAAVQQHGAAGAIDFCSREARRLTAAIEDSIGGVQLGRTTERLRNPANAPDSLDRVVLQELASLAGQGDSLPPYVLRRDASGARYYRPLLVQQLCVQCHGDESALGADVRAILRERYPQDAATGYQVGDLRGVIRVSLPDAL